LFFPFMPTIGEVLDLAGREYNIEEFALNRDVMDIILRRI